MWVNEWLVNLVSPLALSIMHLLIVIFSSNGALHSHSCHTLTNTHTHILSLTEHSPPLDFLFSQHYQWPWGQSGPKHHFKKASHCFHRFVLWYKQQNSLHLSLFKPILSVIVGGDVCDKHRIRLETLYPRSQEVFFLPN